MIIDGWTGVIECAGNKHDGIEEALKISLKINLSLLSKLEELRRAVYLSERELWLFKETKASECYISGYAECLAKFRRIGQ